MQLMHLSVLLDRVFRSTRKLPEPPDADDALDALNYIQRVHIQPVAHILKNDDYTTTAEDETITVATAIATDIYQLTMVRDETDDTPGTRIKVLEESDTASVGVRQVTDTTMLLQGIDEDRDLRFYYEQKLSDLGTATGEVSTPQIDARWHDLYWLGAAGFLGRRDLWERFLFDLSRFAEERKDLHFEPGFQVDIFW